MFKDGAFGPIDLKLENIAVLRLSDQSVEDQGVVCGQSPLACLASSRVGKAGHVICKPGSGHDCADVVGGFQPQILPGCGLTGIGRQWVKWVQIIPVAQNGKVQMGKVLLILEDQKHYF